MNVSIIDLDRNTTLEQNAMTDLLGGCGCSCFLPPIIHAPVVKRKFLGWQGYPKAKKVFNPWGHCVTSAGRRPRKNVFLIAG